MTAWGFRKGTGMDLKGLPQTVQNFIEETIRNRENGKFPDNETCQKVMEYAADTGSQKLTGLGLYYLAECYWQNGEYENTMQCLTESVGYMKKAQMYELLAQAHNMMGAVSDRKNNRMLALSSYYNSLKYAEKYHYYYVQGMAESNIAYTLVRMRLRQEAIQHYRIAIACYDKSEKTYQLNYNRINCMIECGCCHMYLGEMEEALQLWNEIEQILREAPESYYSKITLEMYRIPCELLKGHEEEALKLATDLLGQLSDRDIFEEFMDELVILAGILAILPDGKYLEELIRIIDEKHIEEHYNIFLDLYPFKSELLQKKGLTWEYIDYTRQYFDIYEKYQQENREALINVIELQNRLKNVTLDWTNMKASNRELESLAMHDELTGLANRTFLNEYFTSSFEHAYEEHELMGVELMDIDFFKEYNDHYGHLAGDQCLKAIAGVLRKQQVPGKIFCARYGGDEFMILYTGMTVEKIRRVAEDILRKVRKLKLPHECSNCSNYVSVSQGVFVRIPVGNNKEWDSTSRADDLLYKAKNCGRDGICLSTERSRDKFIEIK